MLYSAIVKHSHPVWAPFSSISQAQYMAKLGSSNQLLQGLQTELRQEDVTLCNHVSAIADGVAKLRMEATGVRKIVARLQGRAEPEDEIKQVSLEALQDMQREMEVRLTSLDVGRLAVVKQDDSECVQYPLAARLFEEAVTREWVKRRSAGDCGPGLAWSGFSAHCFLKASRVEEECWVLELDASLTAEELRTLVAERAHTKAVKQVNVADIDTLIECVHPLSQLEGVEVLQISGGCVCEESQTAFLTLLKAWSSLNELRIQELEWRVDKSQLLIEVAEAAALGALVFNGASPDCAQAIRDLVRQPYLQRLDLRNGTLDDQALDSLIEALDACDHPLQIDLNHNRITAAGYRRLYALSSRNPALQILCFRQDLNSL
ncbi:MAG: hypothetical protein KDK78_06130 [Chlamydiia bacterium]|nr:hypothetical protein [Chlamydiia bacterium]